MSAWQWLMGLPAQPSVFFESNSQEETIPSRLMITPDIIAHND